MQSMQQWYHDTQQQEHTRDLVVLYSWQWQSLNATFNTLYRYLLLQQNTTLQCKNPQMMQLYLNGVTDEGMNVS